MTWFRFAVPMFNISYIKVKDMKRFKEEFLYQALIKKCKKPDLRVYMMTHENNCMELWQPSLWKLLPKTPWKKIKGGDINARRN